MPGVAILRLYAAAGKTDLSRVIGKMRGALRQQHLLHYDATWSVEKWHCLPDRGRAPLSRFGSKRFVVCWLPKPPTAGLPAF